MTVTLAASAHRMANALAVLLPSLTAAVPRGSAVLLLALVLTTSMRRTSASARHVIWMSDVIMALVLPLLTAFVPRQRRACWRGDSPSRVSD